jgi:PAS domain S-box-containing protein
MVFLYCENEVPDLSADLPGSPGEVALTPDLVWLHAAMLDTTDAYIMALDDQGGLLCLSRSLAAFFGRSPEEVMGREFWCLTNDETRARQARERWAQIMQTGGPLEFESQYDRAEGEVSTVIWKLALLRREDGSISRIVATGRDVTQQRRSHEALRAASEMLAAVFEASPLALIVLDPEGRVQMWSPAAERLFGWSAAEVNGQSNPIVGPEQLQQAQQLLTQVMGGQPVTGLELRRKRKDGSLLEVELHTAPLRDAHGHVIGLLGMFTDITRRRKIERDLRESQRALLTLMNNLPGMAYRCLNDRNWTMEYVSAGCRELTGYDEYELLFNVQTSYGDLIHPEDRQKVWDAVQAGVSHGETYQMSYRIRTREGEEKWVWEQGEGVFDGQGQLLALEGLILDITERRLAEQELRQTNETLAALVQYAPLAIVVHDLEGRVLRWNPASEEMFGWSAEEAVGRPNPFVAEEDWEDFSRLLEQAARESSFTGVEVTRRRKDGSAIDLSISTAALRDAKGKVNSIMSIIADLTRHRQAEAERQELQAQLRQADKLRAIGTLAGGVAHDFNNLLTAMQGHAELGLMKLDMGQLPLAELTQVRNTATRAGQLTRQLLAFSRKQPLESRPLSLNLVVSEMQPMLQRLIGEHIRIITDLAPDLGAVKGDFGSLEQVVMNLAVNARDAMPTGGVLTITTHNLPAAAEPVAEAGEGWVELTVSDIGHGMAPETLERIFEPFFTTKEVGCGSGLGLSVAYGIVSQHGGQLQVTSEVGQGTCFRMVLPRTAESVPESRAAGTVVPQEGYSGTILVVEDEEVVRTLVCQVLEMAGYVVLAAGSGEAALDLARQLQRPAELVVTDVVMPGMDAQELAENLTALWPEVKILFMSGYPDGVINQHGAAPAPAALLQKPFSPDKLVQRVGEMLGRG